MEDGRRKWKDLALSFSFANKTISSIFSVLKIGKKSNDQSFRRILCISGLRKKL
jgi:hypothetical protein